MVKTIKRIKDSIRDRWNERMVWYGKIDEDRFVHCDNVDTSLFTLLNVEGDDIINLLEIFKEIVQPTLDLSINPNSTIEII